MQGFSLKQPAAWPGCSGTAVVAPPKSEQAKTTRDVELEHPEEAQAPTGATPGRFSSRRSVNPTLLLKPPSIVSLLNPFLLLIKSFPGAPEPKKPDPGQKDRAGLSEALA